MLNGLNLRNEFKTGASFEVEQLLEKYIKSWIGIGEKRTDGKILSHYQLTKELEIIGKLKEIMFEDELDIIRHNYKDNPDIISWKLRQFLRVKDQLNLKSSPT